MTWERSILDKLRENFGNKVFRTRDVIDLRGLSAKYSKGTLYRVLNDLVKTGKMERLGRGIYRINVSESKTSEGTIDRLAFSGRLAAKPVPGSPMEAKELLHGKGITFMITGWPVLYRHIHNLPKRLIVLVYVTRGSGEHAVFSLRDAGLRALLNPTMNEISLALENFTERDLFVVREFSELAGNVSGFASLERALVDLYFETTRRKTPFPEEEAARIFLNALRKEPFSYSRLKEFAARRGVAAEILAILDFINPSVSPPPTRTTNRRAAEFLETMKKLGWR
jgi:hypothetical protein